MIRIYNLNSQNNKDVFVTVSIENTDILKKLCKKTGELYNNMFSEFAVKPQYKKAFGWIVLDDIPGVSISIQDTFKDAVKAGFEFVANGTVASSTEEIWFTDYALEVQDLGIEFAPKDEFGNKVSVTIFEGADLNEMPDWSVDVGRYSKDDHKEVLEFAEQLQKTSKNINQKAFDELTEALTELTEYLR